MSKLFDERVALVTGASSGIGRATALRFAEEGAAVALLGRDRSALEETSAAVEDLGASSVIVVADLNKSAQCRAAVDETVAFKGRLDVLVNVAGIIASGDLASTTEEGWAEMMR
ncbi:MAG: SDR family oxidoreductase, partial [Acidobacteriota bacterium]|nr:SDR family oxidoreductase [Acidobacteriota bacterium]